MDISIAMLIYLVYIYIINKYMKLKKHELANLVWISRFWAQYSKLPEALKEGFCSLALSITKEIEEESFKQIMDKRSVLDEEVC